MKKITFLIIASFILLNSCDDKSKTNIDKTLNEKLMYEIWINGYYKGQLYQAIKMNNATVTGVLEDDILSFKQDSIEIMKIIKNIP